MTPKTPTTATERTATAPRQASSSASASATTHDTSPGEVQQLLRFALGSEGYAVAIDDVRELIEVPAMTTLPLMPNFVRGVINLRGAVVPVIDLSARLERNATTLTRRSCIVVVDVMDAQSNAPQRVGLLVDGVHEVVDISTNEIEAPPTLGTRVSTEYLSGMARIRGHIVEVLAMHRVLDIEVLADMIGAHIVH